MSKVNIVVVDYNKKRQPFWKEAIKRFSKDDMPNIKDWIWRDDSKFNAQPLNNQIMFENKAHSNKDALKLFTQYFMVPLNCDLIFLHASNPFCEIYYKTYKDVCPICLFSAVGLKKDNLQGMVTAIPWNLGSEHDFKSLDWKTAFDKWRKGEVFPVEYLSPQTIPMLLNLFLPLDIDMQALAILAEKKEKKESAKDPNEYLKEMFKDKIEYAKKNKAFKEKIEALMKSHGVTDGRLNTLRDAVALFLKKLQSQAKNKQPSYIALSKYWERTEYKSFDKWYRELAECLRQINGNEN